MEAYDSRGTCNSKSRSISVRTYDAVKTCTTKYTLGVSSNRSLVEYHGSVNDVDETPEYRHGLGWPCPEVTQNQRR